MQIIGCDIGAIGFKAISNESVHRGAKEITLRVRRIERQYLRALL